ncbi:MAG TPA: patatin-like phospholipase family protein [Thermoleophilaceae bacterium]|nr:patatin-like phospholipase family protein [Thermoleophilaceae bacterium]
MTLQVTTIDTANARDASAGTTAFVLSGGASLGAIQVGMLRALFERAIAPDLIVGTSVGAINGAFVASRPPTVETADALAGVWHELGRRDVFPLSPLTGLLGIAGGRNHLVPLTGLRRLVADHLELKRLEDAPVPLHVVAVDVFSGRERRLSSGPALDAILASAAIPGVFPPVDWEDTELMDGGIANNTPISHALELGADRIYVLPTGAACELPASPKGALAMGVHAMSLLIHQRLLEEVEQFRGDPRVEVLPPPCPLAVQPIDFGHSSELIERALGDARRHLDSGRRGRRVRARRRGTALRQAAGASPSSGARVAA